jgi:hypothetical protein
MGAEHLAICAAALCTGMASTATLDVRLGQAILGVFNASYHLRKVPNFHPLSKFTAALSI